MKAPTLLIDEADTFLKDNDELRGVLNTGHRRGGQVTRTVGDDLEPRQFTTWSPAAIAMIGRLPDTLDDRAIAIRLRRRKATEKVRAFRSDRTDELRVLAAGGRALRDPLLKVLRRPRKISPPRPCS
jgi:putative DNA primase/helicase